MAIVGTALPELPQLTRLQELIDGDDLIAPKHLEREVEEALVLLLRAAASGEVIVEQRRVRLCALEAFRPSEVFASLARAAVSDAAVGLPDRVAVAGLQRWLSSPNGGPGPLVEAEQAELRRCLLRASASGGSGPLRRSGELRYEGFLRLVLPRDSLHREVRTRALTARCLGPATAAEQAEQLPTEVERCFRQLVEEEVHAFRRAGLLRCELSRHLGPAEVLALLRGRSCGPAATRASAGELLTERLGAMAPEQVSVLFQRLDVGGVGIVASL